MRKDSLDMTDEDRSTIRRLSQQCQEECVLITHGTDGMVKTALALQGIPDKRIVLTASSTRSSEYTGDESGFTAYTQ
jgi:L-asparaginase